MTINDQLITYLEELSRLHFSQEEREGLKEDLGKILGYIDKLGELNTQDEDALSHPLSFTNRFREDEVRPSQEREEILGNAPEQKDGCFKVPKTVE